MFFMHCIEDDERSEKYYRDGIEHFKKEFDIEITLFPACTPDTLSPELRFADFKVPTFKRKIKHPLSGTEKACFSTHFELWKRCVKLNIPIMCLEHDARKNPKITEPYDLKQKFEWFCKKGKDYRRDGGICFMGQPPATAYMISPEYAFHLVHWVYKFQLKRRHIGDPNSKGINMQLDTFINEYHNGMMFLKSKDENKRSRYWKKREVFIQDNSYGKVVDHGPLDA